MTALSGGNPDIPATSDAGTSPAHAPRRSDVTLAAANDDEIEAVFHAAPEADLEQGLGPRPPGPDGAGAAQAPKAASKLHAFLAKTDARAAIGQFQNKQHVAAERLPANLPRFKKSVEALHLAVRNPAIPQKQRDELGRLTRELMHKIDRVSAEQARSRKVATALLFSMASIGLCILPLLTANKHKDFQYLALLIAGYAKTMLMLVGLARSATADAGSYATHLKERHVPYLIPTLPYALSAFNTRAEHFEQHHPVAFNGGAAAFIGTMFLLTSAPHLVTGPVSALYDKVKVYLDGNGGAGANAAPAALDAQLQHDIGELADAFRTQHAEMGRRRQRFEEGGDRLSDTLSTQVSDIDEASMKLDDALKKLLGGDSPDAPARANDDVSQKMAFTILAAILCVGSAATYYDEMVGLIDLGADAALTIGELTKTALNPAETAQRAAEKFASYSGLAPLLLPFGTINKIKATHFTDSMAGLVVGTVLLSCANATLPRPTAEFLSQAIMTVMDRIKAARAGLPADSAEPGEDRVGSSSVTITELADGDDDGVAAPGHSSIDIASSEPRQPGQFGAQAESDGREIVVGESETQAPPTAQAEKQ